MALLHRLELPVEGLGFFESGLQLDAVLGAAFPVGERGLAPERLDGVAQIAGAQLGHAVRIEPVIVAEDAEREGCAALAARDVPDNRALLVERGVVFEVDVLQPLADARSRLVALDLALQLVGDLDLDQVDVLLGKERRQLLVHAVEKSRLARQGSEGNDAVLVRFDHPLDHVGEQAPHVLQAFLVGGLALHLGPEDLRWPFAEGLLDGRPCTVGNTV